ncbi:unnamed protein product [Ceratitis capitata]|uniref:(Mediterranean fruit fly) hypothetical protein n=1 Tax=Ceratitis capitata TaxID=7213 RepID=A0A811VF90_CERCA|nr:unnamed protein product [Ceratitis capitata]
MWHAVGEPRQSTTTTTKNDKQKLYEHNFLPLHKQPAHLQAAGGCMTSLCASLTTETLFQGCSYVCAGRANYNINNTQKRTARHGTTASGAKRETVVERQNSCETAQRTVFLFLSERTNEVFVLPFYLVKSSEQNVEFSAKQKAKQQIRAKKSVRNVSDNTKGAKIESPTSRGAFADGTKISSFY